MHTRRILAALAALMLLTSMLTIAPVAVLATSAGVTSQIPKAGTGGPQTGDIPSGSGGPTDQEFPGQLNGEEDADAYAGNIIDRSLSTGHASNGVSVNSGAKAKSSPTFKTGFEGLNHYQQRYSRGGNQFSVEPPDQALCVGNGYVFEAVNQVMNVFNASGQSVLPDNTATNIVGSFPRNVNHAVDLNSFYGYTPAINRGILPGNPGRFGPFITDPTCLYDAATQRFFLVVLTLDTNSTTGGFTLVNHLDIAVSTTGNPTGLWNIYRIDVTADGSPGNTGGPCPCLGDYPHIGADANGFYVTTNAYPWGPGSFDGAQIYAFSKAQLAAGAASVAMVHIDTNDHPVNATSPVAQTEPGFTVWPAQSPGTTSFDLHAGGTEYFLSSNAGEEAAGAAFTGSSTDLVTWALTNTSSLNTATPALSLSNNVLSVGQYGIPPKQQQPGSGLSPTADTPQGSCVNDTTTSTIAGVGCWRLLFGGEPAHTEVISRPDSNDTRMQQVMYANGKLWGALDTALNPNDGPQRAGIAWFIVKPDVSTGSLLAKVALQGYLGATGYDFTYPAVGVTAAGRGVMAFTATGDTLNPSAAYASIDASLGVGAWSVATGGQGATQDDGFTSYKVFVGNPPRTRWGDYGAAAVDGNSVWIASQYIGGACTYTDWGGPFFTGGTGDNLLGTCGGASHGPGDRSAQANWSTRISQLVP
jgi:hypothetical protein